MSDDSDLFIAAATAAAVFTWVGTRRRARDQRTWLRAISEGFVRTWRETPAYLVAKAIRDAFFRKR